MRCLNKVSGSIEMDIIKRFKEMMSMDWDELWYIFSMRLQRYDHEILGIEEEFKKVFNGTLYFSFMNFLDNMNKGFIPSIIGSEDSIPKLNWNTKMDVPRLNAFCIAPEWMRGISEIRANEHTIVIPFFFKDRTHLRNEIFGMLTCHIELILGYMMIRRCEFKIVYNMKLYEPKYFYKKYIKTSQYYLNRKVELSSLYGKQLSKFVLNDFGEFEFEAKRIDDILKGV